MDDYIPIYLIDVKKAIEELEKYFEDYPSMRFDIFVNDYKTRSAVERKVEIMGEAINRILKIQPDFPIPNGRNIVNTRNRIIHDYNRVHPEFLWSLVIRHIPELKKDIERLMAELLNESDKKE